MDTHLPPILRGSAADRMAYDYAARAQGYQGDFALWRDMPIDERMAYESGAAHGDETRDVVDSPLLPPYAQDACDALLMRADRVVI